MFISGIPIIDMNTISEKTITRLVMTMSERESKQKSFSNAKGCDNMQKDDDKDGCWIGATLANQIQGEPGNGV